MSEEKKTLSAEYLFETYKKKLAQRILNGDINLAEELARLDAHEKAQKRPKAKPLSQLKPHRKYTFSESAHEARVKNAQKSTGPASEEGKAASSQNARKPGGVYAASLLMQLRKPCKSTCPIFDKCEVVGSGQTRPGGACLDKVHFLESLDAITKALAGNNSDLQDLVAVELAGILQVGRELLHAIDAFGVIMTIERTDDLGRVIQQEARLNPAVKAYSEWMRDFGLTLREQNITPAAISKVKQGEKDSETGASLLARIMNAGGKGSSTE
ncbi:MAG: hypothetical protein WA666_02370 [Nitrospirota bacterium]